MNKDKEMSANELLAMVAHSDLKEGEVIIKLGGRWILGDIAHINVQAQAGSIPEFEIKGYVK